jgi:hypothetical protein
MEERDALEHVIGKRRVHAKDIGPLRDQAAALLEAESEYEALVVAIRVKLRLIRVLLRLLAPGEWPVPEEE